MVVIGCIADTHDHMDAIEAAVKRFNSEKVALVLHAGDYVSPFVTKPFEKLKAKLIGVFGNNEAEKELIKNRFEEIGAEIRGKLADLTVENRRIAIYHGENNLLLDIIIRSKLFDVVVTGHTHWPKIEKIDGVLVVNPGEACGWLTGKKTIALIDLNKLEAEIIEL
ncbi:MAG: metallophosphoesterase [Candidatus Wukongarchaeota archaeon]|nr:metallophosphoesterase [Candidatus Wukongarchaeota archaeon]MDO8128628.1 metallophosphoesterase [Candidatus Wukongarchaeota archaeon]